MHKRVSLSSRTRKMCFYCVIVDANESIEYSMLTASDNGQAQFVGIDISTFAIQSKNPSTTSQ